MARKILLASAMCLIAFVNVASGYTVSPLEIELTPSNVESSMVVSNEQNSAPVTIAIDAYRVSDPSRPADSRVPADDLLVFPPQAIVPAGGRQLVRIQLLDPSRVGETYHIVTSQVPVDFSGGGNVNLKVGVTYVSRVDVVQ